MNITLNTAIPKVTLPKSVEKAKMDYKSNSIDFTDKKMSLPGYNMVDRSRVNFTGGKTIQEIKAEKNKIEQLQKEYKKQLEYAEKFDYWAEEKKSKQKAEDEIERLGYGVFSPFKKSAIRNRHRADLASRWKEVVKIKDKKQIILDFLAGNATRMDELEEIERTRRAKQARHDMLMAKGGMDDVIAGYENEKKELTKRFLDPIVDEKEGLEAFVPPAIVLYGATGTGKTSFIDALAHQSGAKVVPLETDGVMFDSDVSKRLRAARDSYLKTGQRTILLFNEAEDLLNEAPESKGNVRLFKSILDKCSQLPKDDQDKERFAATVFITTNYPHLIHSDLRTRAGKMGEFIAINPPEQADIKAVIKHYVKKATNEIEAREDADMYSINPEIIPYDKIAERKQPSSKEGAYSNDRLRLIVEKAKDAYIANPKTTFQTHLGLTFAEEKRDLEPEKYNEFVSIYKRIAPLQLTEVEKLEELEAMDCLDEESAARLDYYRKIEQAQNIEDAQASDLENTES